MRHGADACPAPPTGDWPSQGFQTAGATGPARQLADLSEGSEEKRITYADCQAGPVPVITSPEWSGSETGGRRYAPFTVNVEELKPWHTLTGRMHFFLDHDWIGNSASSCRSTGRRWTCAGCSASRRSARTARSR